MSERSWRGVVIAEKQLKGGWGQFNNQKEIKGGGCVRAEITGEQRESQGERQTTKESKEVWMMVMRVNIITKDA